MVNDNSHRNKHISISLGNLHARLISFYILFKILSKHFNIGKRNIVSSEYN